jgi:hypothetical protein
LEPVGVRVQGLAGNDQVLALARLAETRSATGDFTVRAVDGLFHELRLPAPIRIDNVVTGLAKKGLVRKGKDRGAWRVTPVGKATSEALVSAIDLAALEAEAATTGARLGDAPHPVILPEFGAPPSLIPALRKFLAEHEFDRNVFGMTRFPDDAEEEPSDPVKKALDVARAVCEAHALEFHLAGDRKILDHLWPNVAAHMWASRYGIAFFEDLADPPWGLNYNLTIEVGSMMMTGRRCALLKDVSIQSMPTDLVGRIYEPVDLTRPKTVEHALHRWIRDELDLGPCGHCGDSGSLR